ncbi:hypothetical protein PVK62_03445 [Aliivibrio sp. S3MY1]|uniref:hypothetical protein n=1 Tax=unclassified Aliivibrio TaxID=2645654 RepID=UPI002378E8C4|nr:MULTISPECIES: hypothetical protein [unclassified Aliivibrio]MDD9194887.1 hypothetical protein [Aliivibrio sp. S3MY1]MDD9199891.1 hypothetical protein [Aliivibrio sp. S2MY1]
MFVARISIVINGMTTGSTESIQALESITIIATMPFTIILLLGSGSLLKALLTEVDKPKAVTKRVS